MAELTIPEAAAALGISTDTVRRRVKAGILTARTDERGRYLIEVADELLRPAAVSPTQVQEEEIERGLALVERFNLAVAQQVEPIRQELGAASQRLEEANRKVAELADQNGYLRARVEDLERRLAPSVEEPQPETAVEPAPRPWWKFW